MATAAIGKLPPIDKLGLIDIERTLFAQRFRDFIPEAWKALMPAVPYIPNWHIDAMAEHLQAVTEGQIKKLIIAIAPRHAKSLVTCVFWPSWSWTVTRGTLVKPKTDRRELTQGSHVRWVFGAFKEGLATRDAHYSRQLMDSLWYRERWGCRCSGPHASDCFGFRFTTDQNTKTLYENDRGGRRLTASVEAGTTGEGGDILCLGGDMLIATDLGHIPIGRLVDERIACRVLGSSGRWQTITHWHKSVPSEPMVEIRTHDGRVVRCTRTHPVWVNGRGYIAAKEIDPSRDEIYLRGLSSRVRTPPRTRRTLKGPVVFSRLSWPMANRRAQSEMARRDCRNEVPLVPERISVQSEGGREAPLLLLPVPGCSAERSEFSALPTVRTQVLSQGDSPQVLFGALRLDCAPDQWAWRKERSLATWGVGNDLCSWISEVPPQGDPGKRRTSLSDLWGNGGAPSCTSSGWQQDESPAVQLGDALHSMSQETASESDQREHDELVRVASVRSCEQADYVYNLTCGPDHDFYANGILVHNCMDDPIDIESAQSEISRAHAWRYVDTVWRGRLNDQIYGAMVFCGQRTHKEDPSGMLLAEGGWEHLCIPTEYDGRKTVTLLGWRDPRTEPGTLLFPERFGPEQVRAAKRNPIAWSAQHQQSPTVAEGGVFKASWWKFWCPASMPVEERVFRGPDNIIRVAEPAPEKYTRQVQSWDMTFKGITASMRKQKAPDPVAGGVVALSGRRYYVRDCVCEVMNITETVSAVRHMTELHPQAATKLVEDAANGPYVMAILAEEIGGFAPVTPRGSKMSRVITTSAMGEDGKDARALAMVDLVSAGYVYLPHPAIAPWVWEFIQEHSDFPNGSHDDRVDMLSQALAHLQPYSWQEQAIAERELELHGPPPTTTQEVVTRMWREGLAREKAAANRGGRGRAASYRSARG